MTKKETRKRFKEIVEEHQDTIQAKYEKLALLKLQIKDMEKESKELQVELLCEGQNKIKTNMGTLHRQERVSYSPVPNITLLKQDILTQDEILTHAKISAAELKKIIGGNMFESLKEDGVIVISNISEFFVVK